MLTAQTLRLVQDMNLKPYNTEEYRIMRCAIINNESDIPFDHLDQQVIDRLRNIGGFNVNFNEDDEKWIVSL